MNQISMAVVMEGGFSVYFIVIFFHLNVCYNIWYIWYIN